MTIWKKTVMAAGLLGVAVSLSACGSSSLASGGGSDTLNVVFLPSDSAKEETAARKALTTEIHKATGKKSERSDNH